MWSLRFPWFLLSGVVVGGCDLSSAMSSVLSFSVSSFSGVLVLCLSVVFSGVLGEISTGSSV